MQRTRALVLRCAAATLAVGVAVGLTGCGDDEPDAPSPAAEPEDGTPIATVPERCTETFPQAFAEPDLADVASLPADWPEPPAGSTLCLTSTAFGDNPAETMSYVTDATDEEVAAHYEEALASYSPESGPGQLGGVSLTGSGPGVDFEIRADDGRLVIVLQTSE